MARPEGAQALRAIQKDLDEGRSQPVINYILFSKENTPGHIIIDVTLYNFMRKVLSSYNNDYND